MDTLNSDAIYKILEEEIINLTLEPGKVLSENELCSRFNVSRTPIRGVLQRLQENGLVTITPYKGTTVTLLDLDSVNQMIYQRLAVETMVLRDFTKICDLLSMEKMRHLVRESRKLISGSFEPADFYELDSRLHSIWFLETKKNYIWEMIQKTDSDYSRFRMMDIVEMKNFEQIIEEHEELLDILERKDTAAIEPLMKKHLYGGITRLGQLIYTEFKDYFVPVS